MSKGSIASITIVGAIGRDARITQTNGGSNVGRFPVATTANVYKDNGYQDVTTWFNVTYFSRSQKMLEALTKGTKVAVTGELHLDSFVDKNGVSRPTLNLQASDVILLGPPQGQRAPQSDKPYTDSQGNQPRRNEPENDSDFDDNIPF